MSTFTEQRAKFDAWWGTRKSQYSSYNSVASAAAWEGYCAALADNEAPVPRVPKPAHDQIAVRKVDFRPEWRVKIGRKTVGTIKYMNPEFQYFPSGSKVGGDLFPSLTAIIKSLGDEA